MKVEIKKIDSQGRVVLPISWRRRMKEDEVVVIEEKAKVEIFPRDVDLSKYVDSVEVDVDNFEDYHEMRKELCDLFLEGYIAQEKCYC
ncbi:MAG: AbrB/MazE/SpoVT family DNA-binding domain-containing protein [Methanophagales archaeon]|nr:AbrB/MazE/SpoVT family DNA-binding domain-containing protein [Methanophagales archaeon]